MNTGGSISVAFSGRLGAFRLDAAFTAPAGGVIGMLGQSGSGKTTVLRCIAGLLALDGRCIVDGEVWQEGLRLIPTFRRPVGYVFQEASLFPHLSVTGNLRYGLRRRTTDKHHGVSFEEAVALLGLEKLLGRSPRNLSGGERQRVAIGRALLSQPRLLLMDEPLSALDPQAREEILPFIERLRDRRALPIVYVSHDIAEIERLADHVIVMREGRVAASGPLKSLQTDPSLPLFTAREAAVSLDATVEALDETYGLAVMRVKGGSFTLPAPRARIGERRRIAISAGDVSLALAAATSSSILNILPARIVSHSTSGDYDIVAVLALGEDGQGDRLLARVTRRSWERLQLTDGTKVYAQVKSVALAGSRR